MLHTPSCIYLSKHTHLAKDFNIILTMCNYLVVLFPPNKGAYILCDTDKDGESGKGWGCVENVLLIR